MITRSTDMFASKSSDYPYYPYRYWLTPGRIAGIAVGAVVLILVILSMIVLACRRRRPTRETTIFSGQPQSYPTPAWQLNERPLIDASTMPGWYHPPSSAGRSTKSSTPSERASRTAPYSEVQRVPTSDQVQRPASMSQVMRTTAPGQVQRAASSRPVPSNADAAGTGAPGPPQRIPHPGYAAVPSGKPPGPTFPGHPQRTPPPGGALGGPFPGRAQSNPSTARAQAAAAPSQEQEQRITPIAPPLQVTPGAGMANVGDQSPPPYSPAPLSPHGEPQVPLSAQTAVGKHERSA